MKINNHLVVLACCIFFAGCGKNIRERNISHIFSPDPYARLAEKISDGHKHLSNKKVAVLPLAYTDNHLSNDGVVISEKLLTRIINRGELEVIERGLLEKVMAELKLQHSGALDPNSIKGLGKILGVEAVVTGTLTRQKDGRIEINARLIKTESAAVLSAAAEMINLDWETAASPGEIHKPPAIREPRPTRGEIPPNPVQPFTGLIGYWGFNEGYGDITADSSGHGNTGALYGPAWTSDGKIGGALSFDGQLTTKVRMEYSPLLDTELSGLTLTAWFKISSETLYPAIIKKGYGDDFSVQPPQFSLHWRGGKENKLGFEVVDTGNHRLFGAFQIGEEIVGRWTHVAATYDRKMLRVYLNGKEIGSAIPAYGLNIQNSDTYLQIGGGIINNQYGGFSGLIDEVQIFGRALSIAEISELSEYKVRNMEKRKKMSALLPK